MLPENLENTLFSMSCLNIAYWMSMMTNSKYIYRLQFYMSYSVFSKIFVVILVIQKVFLINEIFINTWPIIYY